MSMEIILKVSAQPVVLIYSLLNNNFLDVVKAMDIAFKYRQYFRKVRLLILYVEREKFEFKAIIRISLLIFWFIGAGE